MEVFPLLFRVALVTAYVLSQFQRVDSSQSILGIDPGRNLDLGNLVGKGNKLGIPTIELFGSYDPEQEYDFPTGYPINIDTSLVQEIQTVLPFIVTTGPITTSTIRNTGRSVTIDQEGSIDTITGGPFGNKTYRFGKSRYFWTNETGENARAGTTINNKGYRMEFCAYYFNIEYGSFKKALEHRDGLAVLDFIFNVYPLLRNPLFDLFAHYLDDIVEAGSEVHNVPLVINYAGQAPFNPQIHYIYPGAYFDEDTNKTYYCTTQLQQTELIPAFISEDQFAKFLKLRNYANETYINKLPLQPYRGQPIKRDIGGLLIPLV